MSYETPNLDAWLQKKFITTLTDYRVVDRGKRVKVSLFMVQTHQKLIFPKILMLASLRGRTSWKMSFQKVWT